MIRGNIELVTDATIEGWIFSEDGRIRERTLLAFQGETCVGAGRVNTFRPDLADAGMGDGTLGFSFPISVPAEAVGSVVVKLEGSDALLLQRGSMVTSQAAPRRELGRVELRERLASLKWALKHGRIAQADFDFLRILWSAGVYERGLVHRNAADDAAVTDKPAQVAGALLEAFFQSEVELSAEFVDGARDFAAEIARLRNRPLLSPVVALHTRERAILRVVEGSHVGEPAADAAARAAHFVDYPLSPENLVMLDARVSAELILPEGSRVEMISAVPRLG